MTYYKRMLITGEKKYYNVPSVKFALKLRIFFNVYNMLKFYQKHGAIKTLQQIFAFQMPVSQYEISKIELMIYARNVVSWAQFFLNLFHKKAVCLERSVVICNVLRNITGIHCQVIIGRREAMNSSVNYEFHAWVELNNLPINDVLSVKNQFKPIYCFSGEKEK
jgi:hypothetical protein